MSSPYQGENSFSSKTPAMSRPALDEKKIKKPKRLIRVMPTPNTIIYTAFGIDAKAELKRMVKKFE